MTGGSNRSSPPQQAIRGSQMTTATASLKSQTRGDQLLSSEARKQPVSRPFNLQGYDITVPEVYRNLSPSQLYEHAIRYEKDASIAENGALVAYSGVKTGRSPKDKRIVKHPSSENEVWWGP